MSFSLRALCAFLLALLATGVDPARAGQFLNLAPDELRLSWAWDELRSDGTNGAAAVDLDADGDIELVLASFSRVWQVVEPREDYRPSFTSVPIYNDDSDVTLLLEVAQLDADAPLEVLTVVADRVRIYDGATRLIEHEYSIDFQPTAIEIEDVDDDGALELVVLDALDLFTYEAATGQRELIRYGFGGLDLVVGQIDLDNALEMGALNAIGASYFLDGITGDVDWGSTDPIGYFGTLVDVNGDGCDDLFHVDYSFSYQGLLHLTDVCGGVELWSVTESVTVMTWADFDRDGEEELVVANDGGLLRAYSADGQEAWSSYTDYFSGSGGAVLVADTDADGASELILVDGQHGVLARTEVDVATEQRSFPRRVSSFDVGDLEGDGFADVLTLHYDSYSIVEYGGTRKLEQSVGLDAEVAILFQADSDPEQEIVLYQFGSVVCVDPATGDELWNFPLDGFGTNEWLRALDVTGDGRDELVFPAGYNNSLGQLIVLRRDGSLLWATQSTTGLPSTLEVGDFDLDGERDLALLNRDVELLDTATGATKTVLPGSFWRGLAAIDYDRDGSVELVVATSSGLAELDAATGTLISLNADSADQLVRGRLGILEVLFARDHNGVLTIYADPRDPPLAVLDVDRLGIQAPTTGDFRNIGVPQNALTLGGVLVDIVAGPGFGVSLFFDGFEGGSTASWSEVVP